MTAATLRESQWLAIQKSIRLFCQDMSEGAAFLRDTKVTILRLFLFARHHPCFRHVKWVACRFAIPHRVPHTIFAKILEIDSYHQGFCWVSMPGIEILQVGLWMSSLQKGLPECPNPSPNCYCWIQVYDYPNRACPLCCCRRWQACGIFGEFSPCKKHSWNGCGRRMQSSQWPCTRRAPNKLNYDAMKKKSSSSLMVAWKWMMRTKVAAWHCPQILQRMQSIHHYLCNCEAVHYTENCHWRPLEWTFAGDAHSETKKWGAQWDFDRQSEMYWHHFLFLLWYYCWIVLLHYLARRLASSSCARTSVDAQLVAICSELVWNSGRWERIYNPAHRITRSHPFFRCEQTFQHDFNVLWGRGMAEGDECYYVSWCGQEYLRSTFDQQMIQGKLWVVFEKAKIHYYFLARSDEEIMRTVIMNNSSSAQQAVMYYRQWTSQDDVHVVPHLPHSYSFALFWPTFLSR